MLVHPAIVREDELTAIALSIYSVYNVTNKIRHGGCTPGAQYDALVQMCREGAKGCDLATSVLRNSWADQVGKRLPGVGLLPWTEHTAKARSRCLPGATAHLFGAQAGQDDSEGGPDGADTLPDFTW